MIQTMTMIQILCICTYMNAGQISHSHTVYVFVNDVSTRGRCVYGILVIRAKHELFRNNNNSNSNLYLATKRLNYTTWLK